MRAESPSRSTSATDVRGMLIAGVAAAAVYGASMCREVYWGDSAELTLRSLSLDLTPIARGYPLHRGVTYFLGRALGDPALGANLVSVLAGALAVAVLYEAGRRLGGSRWAGAAAAGTAGLAHTVWYYAGIAEVYTLHGAILASILLLTLDAVDGSRRTRVLLGFLAGISLLHHRMIAFGAPGVVAALAAGLMARPRGDRMHRVRDIVLGLFVGLMPFALLCLFASRSPPEGVESTFAWWFRDVFMGGEANAQHVLGDGKRSLAANALYLARWIGFSFPLPGLLIALLGLLRLRRTRFDLFLMFVLLIPAHLAFPLRYDWTGDQFAFLAPVYPILGILAGAGIAEVAERFGSRRAAYATVASIAAPVLLYVTLAWTPVGAVLFPLKTPEARLRLVAPWHGDERPVSDRCLKLLKSLESNVVLHCDWGDGQVFRYLQLVDGIRPDVRIRIWYGALRPFPGDLPQFVSVLPSRGDLPQALEGVRGRLQPRGDQLFELLPQ